MADPDAHAQKRPRLDSGNNPNYHTNQFVPPPPRPIPPPPNRPASHPTLSQPLQDPSPPPPRHYTPHSLPPPSSSSYPPPGQGYPGPHPQHSPPGPPADHRSLPDPRNILSPPQRPHGAPGPSPIASTAVENPAYRAPLTPHSTSAPDFQSSRPTSIDTKIPPTMDHGAVGHQSPWHMPPDHRPNGSLPPNGYSHAISPSQSTGPVYQQPPPPPPQYGTPGPYAPTPGPYVDQYGAQQVRRKQVRATQACNNCRQRKQKCDEARPCQFCRENQFDCQYKDVPPPKQDRSMMQLQDSVNGIAESMQEWMGRFSDQFNRMERRLDGMDGRLQTLEVKQLPVRGYEVASNHASPRAIYSANAMDISSSRTHTPQQVPRRMDTMKIESPVAQSNMSPGGMQTPLPPKQEAMLPPPQQPATPAESVRTDSSRPLDNRAYETPNPRPKDKKGLEVDHTTPAHQLLVEWSQMEPYYKDLDYFKRLKENGHKVSDYPLQLEHERGVIRIWGVGEGQDVTDGVQGPGSPESSNDSDAASPAPSKERVWGHPPMDYNSPSSSNNDAPRTPHNTDGGLGPDGRPEFNSKILDQLLQSYLDNIHTMHPFMNPGKLRRMVKEFQELYSPDKRAAKARSPAVNGSHQLHQGVKRKRSGSAFSDSYAHGAIERSLGNAIVLLVFAVGKVTAHKDALPAPQSDKGAQQNGHWGYMQDSPHANGGSFNSDYSEDTRQRNIEILPGMAYFAYATDILGNQQGGTTVVHAQAMILASLYLAQYARVLESWSWINTACRITLIIVKANREKLDRNFYYIDGKIPRNPKLSSKEKYRLNLIMCAYWTCLQLETDILAEMSTLPTSNISDLQGDIMYPEGVLGYDEYTSEDGQLARNAAGGPSTEPDMMLTYSSQIWLRVILNEAQNAVYGKGIKARQVDTENAHRSAEEGLSQHAILEGWRELYPLRWLDHDDPASNVNIARIRAKYYGACYVMLRPYLKYSLQHFSDATYQTASRESLSHEDIKMIDVANLCIENAIQSTIAFDRVGAPPNSRYIKYERDPKLPRLVVTNIVGTLHAQFGNILVLASVYNSNLFRLLPKDRSNLTHHNLSALLRRTIGILESIAPNSPILNIDVKILNNVRLQCDLNR